MTEEKQKKDKEVTVGRQGKRISLRCPLVITSAELLCTADRDYSVKIAVEYPESATVRQTVREIVTVVRVTDRDGNPVLSADGAEATARQIQFGDTGLPVGDYTGFSFGLDLLAGEAKPSLPEVSISRLTFEDGSVVDYIHGDFFPVPGPMLPLEKFFQKETVEEIKQKFGEGATCLPEQFSPVVWRCCCGELCQEDTCPSCHVSKSDLFGYFGDTSSLIAPRGKLKKVFIGLLVGLGALVLVELCVFGIMIGVRNASKPSDTTGTTTGKPTVTTGTVSSDAEALADAYLKRNEFYSAYTVATANSLPKEIIEKICREAVDYYGAKQDYDNAVFFAEKIEGFDTAPLYTKLYDAAIVAGDYEKAVDCAIKLGDDAKRDAAVDGAIGSAMRTGDYGKAMELATAYRQGSVDRVASGAVEHYVAAADFEKALEFAAYSSQKEGLTDNICRTATVYYLEKGDFDGAVSFAERVGDSELIKSAVGGMSVPALRRNMPAYFGYLTPDRKREALAETLAVGRFAAVITDDGSVVYGAGLKFVPEDGLKAVSVAVGELHTVILLSDGSVRVLGDNRYGQADTGKWTNVVAVSAGDYHTVGLLSDGTLVACGRDNAGQTKVGSIKSAVSVSAGGRHTLVLTSEGRVVAVGDNSDGQCLVTSWTDVIAISAGDIHSVGLRKDGSVVGAGCDLSGRLDVGSFADVIAISAGKSMTVAVRSDGSVLTAGGTIGQGAVDGSSLSDIVSAVAGEFGFVAVKKDGSFVSAGYGAPDMSILKK